MAKRGKFITLEGGEGSGKSTLSRRLQASLNRQLENRGLSCLLTREPGGVYEDKDTVCNCLRSLLRYPPKSVSLANETELFLFLAAQFQNLYETIEPALAKGNWVICDRYCDSTFCYQGHGRCESKRDRDFVKSLCKRILEKQAPDLTLYLDLDPLIGLKRTQQVNSKADRIEIEALAFHKRVRKGYLALQKDHFARIELIDATLSPQQVYLKALELIQKRLDHRLEI